MPGKVKQTFRYRCSDCGSTKEIAQRPAMPPTCCGNAMSPVQ